MKFKKAFSITQTHETLKILSQYRLQESLVNWFSNFLARDHKE